MLMKLSYLFAALLMLICLFNNVFGQDDKLVAEWVTNDCNGVTQLLSFYPIESNQADSIKSKLTNTWSVEERDLGFGVTRIVCAKGQGYTTSYINIMLYKDEVVYYEIGVTSYAKEWPRIKDTMLDIWQNNNGPEVLVSEHKLELIRQIPIKYDAFINAYAIELGKRNSLEIPNELKETYNDWTNPMIDGRAQNLHQLGRYSSFDDNLKIAILENILRGLNPDSRVAAALTLLDEKKHGIAISTETMNTIYKVLGLDIDIRAGSGCIVNIMKAREIIEEGQDQ